VSQTLVVLHYGFKALEREMSARVCSLNGVWCFTFTFFTVPSERLDMPICKFNFLLEHRAFWQITFLMQPETRVGDRQDQKKTLGHDRA